MESSGTPSSSATGPAAASTSTSSASAAASNLISDDVWNEAVNEWMSTSMSNSAMSQSTAAWNHLVAELPKLKKTLESKL